MTLKRIDRKLQTNPWHHWKDTHTTTRTHEVKKPHMSRDMGFSTMWYFDKCSLIRDYAAFC